MEAGEEDTNWCIVIIKFMMLYWRSLFMVIWPFICGLVFILGFDPEFRCLFVVLLMAGYWVTECIPLYVTGLFPCVLMPVLGLSSTGHICQLYLNKTNLLFLTALFVAISIQHCGLHNRIALSTMLCIGCSPRRLHFGITMITMFLSMFLINSATTAMMCPIIMAVLTELESQGVGTVFEPKKPDDDPDAPEKPTNITKAFFLTAAYASSIGGIGTLVGTGTNLTFVGLYSTRFPDGIKIYFVDWMLFNSVAMLIITFLMWLSLQILLMGLFRKNSEDGKMVQKGQENTDVIRNVIKTKLQDLGPISFRELCVLVLFSICVLLWLFRKPQIFKGWGDFYPKSSSVESATPPTAVAIFLSALPASCAFWSFCTKKIDDRPKKPSPAVMPWAEFSKKMPWGLIFLLGGGFALADAGKSSGMSQYVGEKMKGLSILPSFVVLGLTSLFASILTELTANVAICNITVGVLLEMAVAMRVHPVYLGLPAAICCSFAFCLPVGTPPNAIVTDHSKIKTTDMIINGLPVKFFAWLVIFILFPTYGRVFYSLGDFPEWAESDYVNENPP